MRRKAAVRLTSKCVSQRMEVATQTLGFTQTLAAGDGGKRPLEKQAPFHSHAG